MRKITFLFTLFGFFAMKAQTITSFTPTSGCEFAAITITGTDFTEATQVTIGGTAVSSFTVMSSTVINAVVGTGTTGPITVTTPTGSGNSSSVFTVLASPAPVVITTNDTAICQGGIVQLETAPAGAAMTTLFSENFDGAGLGNFTAVVLSGSVNANSQWTKRTSPFTPSTTVWHPSINSGSGFALSNSDYSGAIVNTALVSGTLNTMGFTSLTLDFRHFYSDYSTASDFAYVEVSTDGGTTWTSAQTYTTDQGTESNFAAASINLNGYINQANFKFRLRYVATWNDGWAIDDVVLSGNVPTQYIWTPSTGLYTNAAGTIPYLGTPANSVFAKPTVTTTYTATTSNGAGCSAFDTVAVNVTTVAAPTGDASQVLYVAATIEDIVAYGTGIIWYPTPEDAAAGTNAIANGTVVVSGVTYYATQTVDSCTSSETLAVTVTTTLGIGEWGKESLSYYPNPVKEMFNMTYTSEITSVSVRNLLGQQVFTTQPNHRVATIDMSGLAKGAYLVTITAGNYVKTIKVIKQ